MHVPAIHSITFIQCSLHINIRGVNQLIVQCQRGTEGYCLNPIIVKLFEVAQIAGGGKVTHFPAVLPHRLKSQQCLAATFLHSDNGSYILSKNTYFGTTTTMSHDDVIILAPKQQKSFSYRIKLVRATNFEGKNIKSQFTSQFVRIRMVGTVLWSCTGPIID